MSKKIIENKREENSGNENGVDNRKRKSENYEWREETEGQCKSRKNENR